MIKGRKLRKERGKNKKAWAINQIWFEEGLNSVPERI